MPFGRHDNLARAGLAFAGGDPRREARLRGFAMSFGIRRPRSASLPGESWGAGRPGAEDPEEPTWLALGRFELGRKEGGARIADYESWAANGPRIDEVPWCGAFVSFCFGQAGLLMRGGGSAIAADWLTFGRTLSVPRPGCVVVMRPRMPGTSGHVGLLVEDRGAELLLLGGNEQNAVTIAPFRAAEVRAQGYRWPRGLPV